MSQQRADMLSLAIAGLILAALALLVFLRPFSPRTAASEPTARPGIWGIANLMPPPQLSRFAPGNAWRGVVGEDVVIVWAGARLPEDETLSWDERLWQSQGLLVVQAQARARPESTPRSYQIPAPLSGGVLTITAARGPRLKISGPQGDVYLDVPSRRFVDSFEAAPLPPATEAIPTAYP